MSVRPSDVFIVTYPKSGTTWLGFLVANALKNDPKEELDLRNFVRYVPSANAAYFGSYSGEGTLSDVSSVLDPRFFSVHAPYYPFFRKVVYVLRDPRDVMVSYYHHRRLVEPGYCGSMREFLLSDDHFPCRWDDHVAGWLLKHRHRKILIVRYEEMLKDASTALERVLDFAGVKYSDLDVLRAVEASQFDRMRSLEERFGVDGAAGAPDERFIRRGREGSWEDELDRECVRIIEEKYGETMCRVGYTKSEW
jgi:hypothetical protein